MYKPQKIIKPNYVRKYDYLRSFYRPKNHWYISNSVIEKFIKDAIKESLKKKADSELINWLYQGDEYDDFDFSDENEFDSYSTYYEILSECIVDMDENDPKIIEGKLIDCESKKTIEQYFNRDKSYQVFNLFDLGKDNDSRFKKTIDLIKDTNNKRLILFQPTFIAKNAISQPDALIINENEIILVETKGTSSTKLLHLFDLFFQKNVINESLFSNGILRSITDYRLCIVKYELLKRNKISFVLIDKCNPNKSAVTLKEQDLAKNGYDVGNISLETKVVYKAALKELRSSKFDTIDVRIKSIFAGECQKLEREIYEKYFGNLNYFWQQINELHDYVPDAFIPPSLEPAYIFKKNCIKDVDYWLLLRDYYYLNDIEYFPLCFSGNLIPYDIACSEYLKNKGFRIKKITNEILSNIESNRKRFDIYKSSIYKPNKNEVYNEKYECSCEPDLIKKQWWSKLKNKKVYFDFESLNLAVRVIDDYPPYMQVVNQVSIIFDHGDKKLIDKPSLIIDPKYPFGKNEFKKIIDSILPSKDLDECKKYSYVVYNKTFEKTRLKEMAEYIGEDEYKEKVSLIVNNIFDLADLFIISPDKPSIIFKKLYGYYSIKKILPLIQKYDISIFNQVGCKDYTTLDIHNGSDAQLWATKRFFGKVSDNEWSKIHNQLATYCNNDVRAMIAVEYLVDKIINF